MMYLLLLTPVAVDSFLWELFPLVSGETTKEHVADGATHLDEVIGTPVPLVVPAVVPYAGCPTQEVEHLVAPAGVNSSE